MRTVVSSWAGGGDFGSVCQSYIFPFNEHSFFLGYKLI